MAPVFSGSLQAKKKSELQSLASALDVSTDGTKEELQHRIKKYLETNQSELEEDHHFSGLFDRRRKRKESVPPRTRSDERSNGRRVVSMVPYEATPAKDLSDVSAFLKNPMPSPSEKGSQSSPNRRSLRSTRSSFVIADTAVDESPDEETDSAADQSLPDQIIVKRESPQRVSSMLQIVKRKQEVVVHKANQTFFQTRTFLSNARTIWTMSVLLQFLFIYISVVPWKFLHIPYTEISTSTSPDLPPVVPSRGPSPSWKSLAITIPYPPLAMFQSRMFWTILLHWFIPTVLIPGLAGILISFKPSPSKHSSAEVIPSESREITRVVRGRAHEQVEEQEEVETPPQAKNTPIFDLFDPLTASIVQLAAQIAYTFPTILGSFPLVAHTGTGPLIKSVDVIGWKWRVLLASVGVAFSFAETLTRSLTSSQPNSSTPGQQETVDDIDDAESAEVD
ncbi:hypothetical protein C8R42DRAFT_717225 [Lentinula raphanica]|nr:hypothetical protein C8R42DRAFT_717225 [Lentinula raphanica]